MARRATVTLELKAAQYLAEAKAITQTTKGVEREVDDLGRKADKAGRDMDKLAAQEEVAKKQTDGLGKQARQTKRELAEMAAAAEVARISARNLTEGTSGGTKDLNLLKLEIRKVEDELRLLAREYEQTGSAVTKASFRQRSNVLADLKAIERQIGSLGTSAVNMGSEAASGFGAAFKGGITSPVVLGAIGVLIAGLLPGIGAMVAGAITGVVGAGGVIGGILAAKNDPRVKLAASQLAQSVSQDFTAAGRSFVYPIVGALDTLRRAELGLHLDETFRIAAPYVQIFADGIAGLATNFMPKFNDALKNAQPVIEAIGRDLPKLGTAFGDFFDELSKGEGNAAGIDTTFEILDNGLKGLGVTIRTLSDLFANTTWLDITNIPTSVGESIAHSLFDPEPTIAMFHRLGDSVPTEKIESFGKALHRNLGDIGAVASAIGRAAEAYNELVDSVEKYIQTTTRAKDVSLAWKMDMLDLAEAAKANGTSLNQNKREGLENSQMLLRMAGDADRFRQSLIDQNVPLDVADAKYRAMIRSLEKQAIALGYNKDQVHGLLDYLLKLPDKVNTTVKTTVTIHYLETGLDAILRKLSAAGSKAGGELFGQLSYEAGKTQPKYQSGGGGKQAPARAAGGPVIAGMPYRINERGSETVTFPASGVVHPASLSPAAAPQVYVTVNVDPIDRRVRNVLITDAQGRNIPPAQIAAAYP